MFNFFNALIYVKMNGIAV